jgi:DNA-directed RNA polymerase subunit RPC12/RpoP
MGCGRYNLWAIGIPLRMEMNKRTNGKHCPKCQGQIIYRNDNYIECALCDWKVESKRKEDGSFPTWGDIYGQWQ